MHAGFCILKTRDVTDQRRQDISSAKNRSFGKCKSFLPVGGAEDGDEVDARRKDAVL
jgi:hypothetical protein